MPRIKFDYVVSFSSESPEAPANSLLSSEPGRGRWLCARGEPSCSVLLQLPRAVQITSITIGAHLAALVEVLVGRSETPNDPFQVLVASSVFLSPTDSRRATEGDSAADRVRSFNTDQLATDVRSKRWDRVRVVCSQPYNKHCKYGLSFVHVFSPEGNTAEKDAKTTSESMSKDAKTKPGLKLPLDMSPQDSDDDEFKPGALFAAAQSQSQESSSSTNTDAQIRKATSQAIKNVFGSSTKIVRTPISKPKCDVTQGDEPRTDRTRDSLMYEDEDAGPNDKIDRLVAAHKEQQAKTVEKANKEKEKQQKNKEKTRNSESDSSKQKGDRSKDDTAAKDVSKNRNTGSSLNDSRGRGKSESGSKSPQTNKKDKSSSGKRSNDEDKQSKKQKVSEKQDTDNTLYAGPVSKEPHKLLQDVVFVMSGYENPRRATVRDAALAMGAQFQRDWGPGCTHLICAFSNTPKLKTVRSSPHGDKAIVVTAEWIERQAARCRRLPWQWFATEQTLRVKRARAASSEDPPGGTLGESDSDEQGPSSSNYQGKRSIKDEENKKRRKKDVEPDSECDTDDEIERVMRNKQKRAKVASDDESPNKKSDTEMANVSQGSDIAFVRDERIKGEVTTISDSDDDSTDKEDVMEVTQDPSTIAELPSFFEGCTFAIHPAAQPLLDEKLVRRYVRAYGGDIVEALDDDDEVEVDYILCLSGNTEGIKTKGQKVRGDWVWKCHETRKLWSPEEFAL